MKSITAAAVAALYAAAPAAAKVSHCPGSNSEACYQWAVASSSSSSSSSGAVYLQIQAPSSYQWVGLGIGSQMRGAEMFIVYQDGSGNVTLSTRSAPGHVEPSYEQRSGVELLAGSGVSGGKMTANVRCTGECSSGLDTSGESNWIGAWRSSGDLQSSSNDADISMHNSNYGFRIDMSQAGISSDSNPFLGSSQDSGSSGGNSDNSGGAVTEDNSSGSNSIIVAHGVVMAVTFAILYPIGAILMPILGRWLVHGVVQFVAFLAMWAGFGLGYYYANQTNSFFTDTHMRLGTIVVALLGIQPILGWIHHAQYKRYQRRTIVSHVHIWYGRILMALGIVNGGMGLRDQDAGSAYKIAYAVVAGVLGGLYIGAAVWGVVMRRRNMRASSKGSGVSG